MFFTIKKVRTHINSDRSKSLTKTPTLFLPPELVMLIVEQLPDVQSAKGLFVVDKATNNFFKTYLLTKSSTYRSLKKEARFYSNLHKILTWNVGSVDVLMALYVLGLGGMAYFSYLITDKGLQLLTPKKLDNEPIIQLLKLPCLFIGTIAGTVAPIPRTITFLGNLFHKSRRYSNRSEIQLKEFIQENKNPINLFK